MKLPWSKQKYQYSRHSAPITNGILRNGKGSEFSNRSSDDSLHVSFALQRTGRSQMSLDHIHAATMGKKLSASRGKYPSHRIQKAEYSRTRRKNDRGKTEKNERDHEQQSVRKTKSMTLTRKEHKRSDASGCSSDTQEHKLQRSITSETSDGSSDTLCSLKKSPRRLGDLPAEKIASGYGESESIGTLDTIMSESSAECPRLQTETNHLSLLHLLDEKQVDKKSIDRANECNNGTERPGKQSKRLSALLDEKIKAKMKRQAQEKMK